VLQCVAMKAREALLASRVVETDVVPVLRCVCCSVLQSIADCYSVLQCVAVCCSGGAGHTFSKPCCRDCSCTVCSGVYVAVCFIVSQSVIECC